VVPVRHGGTIRSEWYLVGIAVPLGRTGTSECNGIGKTLRYRKDRTVSEKTRGTEKAHGYRNGRRVPVTHSGCVTCLWYQSDLTVPAYLYGTIGTERYHKV